MRNLLTREVAGLLGTKPSGLAHARQTWGVLPFRLGRRGTGNSSIWTPMQTLALLVAKCLNQRGVTHREAGRVVELLWTMTPAELETAFGEGRTCLLVCLERVLPRFLHPDAILSNENIQYDVLARLGVRPWGLNVKTVWDKIEQEVAKLPAPARRGMQVEEACH